MKIYVNASVKMPPALHARVAKLAEIRKRSTHAVMLHAPATYVEREEKREAWRQEGTAAWEEYRRTGLHLTNAEVMGWLSQLAAGNNVEPPECRI
jgi:predicted transcriptional regulator